MVDSFSSVDEHVGSLTSRYASHSVAGEDMTVRQSSREYSGHTAHADVPLTSRYAATTADAEYTQDDQSENTTEQRETLPLFMRQREEGSVTARYAIHTGEYGVMQAAITDDMGTAQRRSSSHSVEYRGDGSLNNTQHQDGDGITEYTTGQLGVHG